MKVLQALLCLVPSEDFAIPEVEAKVKESEGKVEIAEKMAVEAEKNPLPPEDYVLGDVYHFLVGWWPVISSHSATFQFHFWFGSIFISILSWSIHFYSHCCLSIFITCLPLFIIFHYCSSLSYIFFVVQLLPMKLQMNKLQRIKVADENYVKLHMIRDKLEMPII